MQNSQYDKKQGDEKQASSFDIDQPRLQIWEIGGKFSGLTNSYSQNLSNDNCVILTLDYTQDLGEQMQYLRDSQRRFKSLNPDHDRVRYILAVTKNDAEKKFDKSDVSDFARQMGIQDKDVIYCSAKTGYCVADIVPRIISKTALTAYEIAVQIQERVIDGILQRELARLRSAYPELEQKYVASSLPESAHLEGKDPGEEDFEEDFDKDLVDDLDDDYLDEDDKALGDGDQFHEALEQPEPELKEKKQSKRGDKGRIESLEKAIAALEKIVREVKEESDQGYDLGTLKKLADLQKRFEDPLKKHLEDFDKRKGVIGGAKKLLRIVLNLIHLIIFPAALTKKYAHSSQTAFFSLKGKTHAEGERGLGQIGDLVGKERSKLRR